MPLGHKQAYNTKKRFQLEQIQYLEKSRIPMQVFYFSNAIND
jgi:hypothetical protein